MFAAGYRADGMRAWKGQDALLAVDLYDAWGNLPACQDPSGLDYDLSGDPFGYGAQYGYYTDRDTDLILCTLRDYDPAAGRWLTPDPIGYAGGFSVYAYCDNNPVGLTDLLGLCGEQQTGNWYMDGMGGVSDWVDKYLMGGQTERFGRTWGLYDAGKATALEVAWEGAKWRYNDLMV